MDQAHSGHARQVWAGIESIVYYVLMPALLFSNISQADLTDLPWGALLAGLYIPTLVLSAIAIAPMLWRNSLTRATRSSLFQGISRFNPLYQFVVSSFFV